MAIDVEETYRTHGPMVLRRCQRLLRNESQAEDAMHDVFVQLLRNYRHLDERGPSALLYRIATNVCLNRLRGHKRRPEDAESELLDRIIAADPRWDSRLDARSVLDRALGRQPVGCTEVAVLHLIDGLTLQETANVVGLSVSGVRKRLRRLGDAVRGVEREDA